MRVFIESSSMHTFFLSYSPKADISSHETYPSCRVPLKKKKKNPQQPWVYFPEARLWGVCCGHAADSRCREGGGGMATLFIYLFIFIWLYVRGRNGPATKNSQGGMQWDFQADVVCKTINRKVKLGKAWYNPFWEFHLVPLHWFSLAFLQFGPICASSELQSQSQELWPLSRFLLRFSQPAFAFSCCHPLESRRSLS